MLGGLSLDNATISIGSGSTVAPQGNQTIDGTGTFVFTDGNAGNRFNVEQGNLVLGSGITLRGNTGRIGAQSVDGGAATLENNGTITADVDGGTINLQVNGLTTNKGTLAAQNGGTLVLSSQVNNLAGSQILVGVDSTVLQNGVTLNGTINVNGGGSFQASNSGFNVLNGADFTGVLDLASGLGVERVVGGLTLNGRVDIGSGSTFAPQGNQTIDGTGTFVFTDGNAGNRFNLEQGNLVLGSGITVRGRTGRIGAQSFDGGAATLTNNGTISADVDGGTITLQVNGLTTNNGTLSALNGGTLLLNSAVTGTTGSQIIAGAGSSVVQNGVTLAGDLVINGIGSFRASNSGSNALVGVTFAGVLDLASEQGVERVFGGLTLDDATIFIGNGSVFAPEGNQTIGGTGTIVFADTNGSNRINVEQGNLTLGSGIVVRGGNGIIGQQAFNGGAANLTNQGLITADVDGTGILVDVLGTFINQGALRAENGGLLTLQSTPFDNSAGTIVARDDSRVLISNASVTGGVLNSEGTGRLAVTNSGNNFLQGVTVNGVLDVAAGVVRTTAGGMVLNGRIDITGGGVFAPEGNQTISGTGSIVFADGNGSNRLNVEQGNLVIGSGVTVRGTTGAIGQQAFNGGASSLTNNGSIVSDGGGTISINVNGALGNNGVLRAQNGALNIADNLAGTGSLRVDSTGVMTLANGGNTQGSLVLGASGASLNVGTGNLTINTDYTNTGAGTGNAFNRRAGVTGTGLILSGGNAAQAITGSDVTGGNTTNATLTIGNVRVGANTFNYQVANTGTTGPTLRGAIQTNVNGGNISDVRLSGSGVTASNYNAGGPGANSGNLAVTFTTAMAGTLVPLTGQAVNLRSNFEDIADQKLNLVLQGGAAAYNAAIGSTGSPVTIANQRVGGTNAAALSVLNAAAVGSFSEDLNATIGGTSSAATATGSVLGLLAGSTNSSGISVGVNTATAGAKSGTVMLDYVSTGTVNGVSNSLAPISVGSQGVSVSGNVYQLASGDLLTAPLNFVTVQVGQAVSRTLSIRNTAIGAAGFVEDLNASFGLATGTGASRITGTGSINGLLAGATNSSAMVVNVDTSTAGTVSGAIAVNYVSAGAVAGMSNGLGTFAVGSDAFAVNGDIETAVVVINRASPLVNTPSIDFGARRVGDAAPTASVSVTNVATVDPQAALDAVIASNGVPVTASGSFGLLAPGATNAGSLLVGLDTSTSGNFTGANAGSATVSFVSNAANVGGCEPDCALDLASQPAGQRQRQGVRDGAGAARRQHDHRIRHRAGGRLRHGNAHALERRSRRAGGQPDRQPQRCRSAFLDQRGRTRQWHCRQRWQHAARLHARHVGGRQLRWRCLGHAGQPQR